MADSDFNFIPPVEHLQNVPALTPAKDREQRKRRPRRPAGQRDPAQQDKEKENNWESINGESHSIDYCA
jgi:hypothetical protein